MQEKIWLKNWPWETVVALHAGLCKAKETPMDTNPQNYEEARALWENSRFKTLSLHETLALCRRCHLLSPFSCYNGNTFAAIGRTIVEEILQRMSPDKAHAFRSVVGHYIAGTAGDEELAGALVKFE